jgi:hypothetical protein
LNGISSGSQIQQLFYSDGTGALQLQTRREPAPPTETGLFTNILLTPFGQVVIGAPTQNDIGLSSDDSLVVKDNFRLIPTQDFPICNHFRRGMLLVKENEISCGQNSLCKVDSLYLCSQDQTYEWKKISN